MAQVNIQEMATYGLFWQWASDVFNGKSTFTQPVTSPKVNLWRFWDGFAGSTTKDESIPYGDTSTMTIEGIDKIEGKDLIVRDTSKLQVLDYIYKYNTDSNPIILNGAKSPGTSTSPLEVYLDKSNVTTQNITISPKTSDVTMSAGSITHTQAQVPTGNLALSTYTFQFDPGVGDSHSFTSTQSNSASYTTTFGTTSSTSNSNESSFNVSSTVSASYGVVDATASVSAGWSKAWTSMNEVDFSKSTDSVKTDEVSATTKIQPNAAALNSDGTYTYTAKVAQPGGGTVTHEAGFVPGLWYQANITKTETTIQNNLTGTYVIGGSMGTLSDSNQTGGSVSITAAKALSNAISGGYNSWDMSNFLGNLMFISPSDLTIDYIGGAAGTATINSNWTVTYAEDASKNDSASVASSKSMKRNSNHMDLNKFDTTRKDGLGISYAFDEDSNGKKTIIGTMHPDIVHASKKGKHHFSKFADSFLHGNEKADKFVLGKRASGNSIYAFGGNDKVNSSSSQTASMGDGNDVYTINSNATKQSFHRINLGAGEDKVIVNSAKAQFTIADFHPFMDTVKVGKSMDENLLSAKLVPFENGKKILDNAKIQFLYNDSPIGIAYLSSDTNFIQELIDPITHQSIMMLNSAEFKNKHFNIDPSSYNYFANSVKTGVAYSRPLTPDDWETMNNDQRSEIMSDIYSISGYSDFTKEDALNILNSHHNPSDFSQVMFN